VQVGRAAAYWVRSGRAESDGRLEQWYEYLALQESAALGEAARKETAQVTLGGGGGRWHGVGVAHAGGVSIRLAPP
jgi:hypothetical protein